MFVPALLWFLIFAGLSLSTQLENPPNSGFVSIQVATDCSTLGNGTTYKGFETICSKFSTNGSYTLISKAQQPSFSDCIDQCISHGPACKFIEFTGGNTTGLCYLLSGVTRFTEKPGIDMAARILHKTCNEFGNNTKLDEFITVCKKYANNGDYTQVSNITIVASYADCLQRCHDHGLECEFFEFLGGDSEGECFLLSKVTKFTNSPTRDMGARYHTPNSCLGFGNNTIQNDFKTACRQFAKAGDYTQISNTTVVASYAACMQRCHDFGPSCKFFEFTGDNREGRCFLMSNVIKFTNSTDRDVGIRVSTSSTATATKTTTDSVTTPTLPPRYRYVDCFVHTTSEDRLSERLSDDSKNSPEKCGLRCSLLNFRFSGTQDGQQCYCGHVLPSTRAPNECTTDCPGDKVFQCGASSRITVLEDVLIRPPETCSCWTTEYLW